MMKGIVLAGGKSSRFGTDKALAVYKGSSLIERSASLLKDLGLEPVIVARKGVNYSLAKCPVIYDKLPDLGPLGGIYTAMSVFKNSTFLILTCDMPSITPDILKALLQEHSIKENITVFSVSGETQPFPGIYQRTIFSQVYQNILEDHLSMRVLFDQVSGKKMLSWQGDPAFFSNINKQETLNSLL